MSTGLQWPRSSIACWRSSRSLQSTAWRNFVSAPGWSVRLQRKRNKRCFSSAPNWRRGRRISSFKRRNSSALGRASRSFALEARDERASRRSFNTAGCSLEASWSTKHLKQRPPALPLPSSDLSGCSSQPGPPRAARLLGSTSSLCGEATIPVGTSISCLYCGSAKITGCRKTGNCRTSQGTPEASSAACAAPAKKSSLASAPAAAGSQPRLRSSATWARRGCAGAAAGPGARRASSCRPCRSTARPLKRGSTPR
mmetsp:Transcript_3740/g.11843  ORF Transcript_3740/g.11843 Transcript_3740/m.11843 type:complete len:255 (-) Transcript_3740:557-1321(-)